MVNTSTSGILAVLITSSSDSIGGRESFQTPHDDERQLHADNKPMKTPIQNRSVTLRESGFALVITISLMVLLVIVAVGLLTLSSISLRSSSSQEAMATARANARMAMMLAIGELQKQTGPDQSITIPSGIPVGTGSTEPLHPNWAGAVNVRNLDPKSDPKQSTRSWLVSGFEPDPA